MALLPNLDQVFREEAARRGVLVEEAEQTAIETAENRVAWLREKHAVLLAKREALGEEHEHSNAKREQARKEIEY